MEFYLLYLFTLLDFINGVAGYERHNPTLAKHDETTLNIRETEKNKGKKTVVKIVFLKKRE